MEVYVMDSGNGSSTGYWRWLWERKRTERTLHVVVTEYSGSNSIHAGTVPLYSADRVSLQQAWYQEHEPGRRQGGAGKVQRRRGRRDRREASCFPQDLNAPAAKRAEPTLGAPSASPVTLSQLASMSIITPPTFSAATTYPSYRDP